MRTLAQKQNRTQQKSSANLTKSIAVVPAASHQANSILHLQSTIGNQGVLQLLQTSAHGPEASSDIGRATRFAHDFSRIPVHAPITIQPKLALNTPEDIYEQEADQIAEHVMRAPGPKLQRACDCGGGCPSCQTHPPSQEHQHVQTKQVGSNDSAAPPSIHEVLASPGQPLDTGTRAYMEPRFGRDFSRVRVHTDTTAQARAAAEGALSYTAGRDLVFGAGQYQPQTMAGRWLIAHELAHVIQQQGSVPPSGPMEGALEREAGEAGMRVALGGSARVSGARGGPAVQFLRVSQGGFGRALEEFTNKFSLEDKAINLLKNSTGFMKLVNTLDKHYVSPFDVPGLGISPSTDPPYLGPDGRLLRPAAFVGKRPLYFGVSAPSFEPFKAPYNSFDGDLISLIITDTPTFIQGIAHEATHAANFVGGPAPKPQTLVEEIEAGTKDEIAARKSEATILEKIPAKAVKAKVAEVGSRDPREVQRDVSPAFDLTYLEMFFFARELRDAKEAEKLDEQQAAQLRSKIDQYHGSYATALSQESWSHSKYARTWFDRKTAMLDWREFMKTHPLQDATSAAKKEKLVQDHAKWFFYGKVSYLP